MRQVSSLKIGVIGAGNMGQALIKGLRDAGVPSRRILAVEAKAAARQALRRYQVKLVTLERAASTCNVLILAVKPQDLGPVLQTLRQQLQLRRSRVLVISIAAGVTLASLERRLGRVAVVRVMPNLAAKVGCAMSAVAAGRWATAGHRAAARQMFGCVGRVVELPERLFDAVTAISGSGPAYFFLIFRSLRDAGVRQGLPKSVAEELAVQTAVGAACVADGLGEDLDRLITQVASKGGTTEAALKVFERRKLSAILQAGVASAATRSKELSRQWSSSRN